MNDIFSRRFSVAPMMGWTDRHCRYFHRQLSKKALLYTEMVTANAIIYGKINYLSFNNIEHPVALQLGGNDPFALAKCAKLGEILGYDEINLNVGCPSYRAQKGFFGACMMSKVPIVSNCIKAMRDVVNIPVTIKTRIGIDDQDSYDFLCDFIGNISQSGCEIFIIHARKACLSGLNAKKNRKIPLLNYSIVYRLKNDFPKLTIILNGGIKTLEEVKIHLKYLDGVMLGRAVYQNPGILAKIDYELFENNIQPINPIIAIRSMYAYIEEELAKGTDLNKITRHMLGLFKKIPNASKLRDDLTKNMKKSHANTNTLEHILLKAISIGI